ncbi:MAG: M16 family metallopeptidase [Oligoflexales bacterium]
MRFLLPIFSLILVAGPALGKIVSPEAVEEQKKLTTEFKLKNSIPVFYRQIADSDILQIDYVFDMGFKDGPAEQKVAGQAMFSAMGLGAEGWPRTKIFELTEKYSAGVGCAEAIEYSACSLSTVNDYYRDVLPLFAAIIKKPTFANEDVKLVVDRLTASYQSSKQDPARLANEAVNTVFYGSHPYFQKIDDAISELGKLVPKDLKLNHKRYMNSKLQHITVVGSLPVEELRKELDKNFGDIQEKKVPLVDAIDPVFKPENAVAFTHKPIPTAYINIKMNAPGVLHEDSIKTNMMLTILSEELGEEIRTKRSLSYGVYANLLDYGIGIAIISATTSKPKETLEAIKEVIQKLKTKTYTQKELDDYRTGYATGYFRTLETHAALSKAISSYVRYYGSTDQLYQRPLEFQKVKPSDIRDMANKYLKNFRIGVVFDKAKYDENWSKTFVQTSVPKS